MQLLLFKFCFQLKSIGNWVKVARTSKLKFNLCIGLNIKVVRSTQANILTTAP